MKRPGLAPCTPGRIRTLKPSRLNQIEVNAMPESNQDLAKAAYIFGFPLVYNVSEVISQTTAPKVASSAPINLFGHAQALATPSDEFVSLNNDTLYSIAHCDVTGE